MDIEKDGEDKGVVPSFAVFILLLLLDPPPSLPNGSPINTQRSPEHPGTAVVDVPVIVGRLDKDVLSNDVGSAEAPVLVIPDISEGRLAETDAQSRPEH